MWQEKHMLKDEELLSSLILEYLEFSFSLAKGESRQLAFKVLLKRNFSI